MRFTNSEKSRGEMAVWNLSEKAQRGYDETDPMTVYEYENDGRTLYAVEDADGIHKGLNLEELEEFLEAYCIEE